MSNIIPNKDIYKLQTIISIHEISYSKITKEKSRKDVTHITKKNQK